MTDAGIPEAPREPLWRTCLARRWVLGLVGFILLDMGLTLWAILSFAGQTVFPIKIPIEIVVGAVVGPGVVVMGFWLRGVLKLRVMLREGTLARGEVLEVKKIRNLNPPHVKLRYRVADDVGRHHEASQFVRAGSAFGKLLLQGPATVAVIHEPNEPSLSRAVCAADFLAT